MTLGLKAVSIGAPAVRVVDSLPEAASIQGDHNSGRPQFETPSPEASREDLADLLSLANAFEASTLDLSAADSGRPEDTPPKEGDHSAPAKRTPRAKSAQRVRIDESLNKIDTPKSEARAQDGGVYARLGSPTRQARLGSPTRQARLGSPPRSKGGKGSNAAFKAGGKAALLAANSKFLAAPVSPRKQAVRRVDATAVGDRYDLVPCSLLLAPWHFPRVNLTSHLAVGGRLSSHRPKRHGEEAAHVLAGEHSAQWATRLGSPTREQRLQSPNRRAASQGDGDKPAGAAGSTGSAAFDVDRLRQELRSLKLMALHERATRTKVTDDAIERALEVSHPHSILT